jgi:poly(3-hydroxybutyrate) depolymerase
LLLAAVATPTAAAGAAYLLAEGPGSFVYAFRAEGHAKAITVWYHRPHAAGADAPVVFVMHGRGRNGETYRRHWIPHAEKGQFILLVPQFSRAGFGRIRQYQFGNVTRADGTMIPDAEWSFTALENIFDAVRLANLLTAAHYDIYGHSAGGQFVHRMALVMPAARFRVAVAANAGSYAMPDPDIRYPYGLGGLESANERLRAALSRRLIVLLGSEDIDPDHPSLPRAPEAKAQGAHRFERGKRFFDGARSAAARLGVPFNWSIEITHGAHSNAQMASAAARRVGRANGANGDAQAK